jgi:hypothetical protein
MVIRFSMEFMGCGSWKYKSTMILDYKLRTMTHELFFSTEFIACGSW